MNEDLEALQFTSNVIELKPDKKYLLLFKEINYHQLNQVQDALRSHGFDCLCITTPQGHDVRVIEAPAKPEPEMDREGLDGFRATLGGVGGSGAVLDESMIERTFNKELWGTW